MKKRNDNLLRKMRIFPIISSSAVIAACLYGLYLAAYKNGSAAAVVMWLWGVSVIAPYCRLKFILKRRGNMLSRICGFLFVAASIAFSYYGYQIVGVSMLFVAPVAYFANPSFFAIGSVSVLIWTLGIPNIEYLHFLISYPMRLIGAECSAAILSLMGFAASSAGTVVSIGSREIAVTSACSGIEQLEAMLFVGWIIAVCMNRKTLPRILHFVTILSIIVISNCMRLVLTLAGLELFGEVFLSDSVHTLLGILTVIVSVLMFIGVGLLFVKDVSQKKGVKCQK